MRIPLFDQPVMALVRRELLTALRSKGLFIGLALLVTAYAVAVAGRWPADDLSLKQGIASGSAGAVFRDLCAIMLLGAALVMPGFAAGTLASEREDDTYEQLRLTLLRPGGILLGKFVGALAVFGLFFTASMPAFATVIFLVGMDGRQLFGAATVIVMAGIACTSLGLAAGAVFMGTVRSLVGAYVLVLQYMGLPLLLVAIVFGAIRELTWPAYRLGPLEDWVWRCLEGVIPLEALSRASAGSLSAWRLMEFAGFSLLLSGACLVLAWRCLRRPVKDAVAGRLARRGSLRPARAADVFCDGLNPVFEREMLASTRRPRSRAGLTVLLFLLFLPANLIPAPGGKEIAPWFDIVTIFGFQMLILLWVAPAYAAPMLTRERAQGNLDALRATMLSPGEVVAGKTLGALGLMAPLLVAQLACGLPHAILDPLPGAWVALLTGYVTLAVTVLEAVCLAMVASALARRTATAVVLGYIFSALAYGGAALALLFVALTFLRPNGEGWVLALAYPSAPLAYAFSSTMYAPGSRLSFGPVGYRGAIPYWGLNVALHAAFSYGCFRLAVFLHERRNRRDS